MTYKLELPWPPSNNTYWRHPTKGKLAGRHLISEKGRAYRKEVIQLIAIRKQIYQLTTLLKVHVQCFPPDRRKRDLGNLDKALFDTLTHAGVWMDDSQIDDQRFRRARTPEGKLRIRPGGMVIVFIQELDPQCD